MPKLELTYFDAPGRAEPVRIALELAKVPFTDHRLKFADFMALKLQGALPLGSVPVLDVDGVRITQTAAMLRYVARLGAADLYPSDPFAALIVDSAIDTLNDTLSHAIAPSLHERDKDKKLAMRSGFIAGPMRQAFTYVEGLLGLREGPFLAGTALSIGDILVANQVLQILEGHLDGISAADLEPYPRLRQLAEAYLAEPRIAAYRSARQSA